MGTKEVHHSFIRARVEPTPERTEGGNPDLWPWQKGGGQRNATAGYVERLGHFE
jgi:hypothetical protein